ncbi:hypothetical protein [Leptothoe spongobia]|uniref:Uncharacterized protein n=1 Tax=Leptothoe spongobia TAU-MAC 1115 TaxID=1967444 RepID=A0A947GJM3_9CYAN|nr:hypothetical protein [Leptothoe spongobia]MBT9315792.1 hypothetical protein [Leptothoe spongobia TAU-MAC 1115]
MKLKLQTLVTTPAMSPGTMPGTSVTQDAPNPEVQDQIKTLLQDKQLCQKIQQAANPEEAISLVKTAAISQGYQLSNDSLSQLLQMQADLLSEAELLSIAGGIGVKAMTALTHCTQPSC